jgi:hypothetical protein
MTSWGGNRQYAQVKKVQESVPYFQTTEGGFCSNFNLLFSAYLTATRNSSILYIHDFPNSVGDSFPMLQSILRENSSIKYLKEVPANSQALDPKQIVVNPYIGGMNAQTLKRLARDLFFYNSDTQEKIMTRIRSAGLERTPFDVGVHIRSGDMITTGKMQAISIQSYVDALRSFSRRLGKGNLSIFVMTDNMQMYTELVKASPQTWNFTTLQNPSSYTSKGHDQNTFKALSPKDRMEHFYQFLTELHILQNTPNLVVTYSSNIGRFLYLTSRFQHTADSILSLDVPQWSLF